MQLIKDMFDSIENVTQEEKVEMTRLASKLEKIFRMKELLRNINNVDRLNEMIAEQNDD